MVKLMEENLGTNKFIGLTEECQLAINGGCTSRPSTKQIILHEVSISIQESNGDIHWRTLCPTCKSYYGY